MRAMSSTRYHGPRGVLRPKGGLRSTGRRPPGGERAWPQGEFPSAPPTPTSQGESHRQGAGENPGQAPAGRGIPEANDPSVTLAASRRIPCAVNIAGKGHRRSAGGGSRRRDFRVSTRLWPHGGGKNVWPQPRTQTHKWAVRQERESRGELVLARPRPDLLGPPPGVLGRHQATVTRRSLRGQLHTWPRGHGSLECRSPRTQ